MPGSLILEGVAQVGGLLVGEVNHFEDRVILAKVSRAHYHRVARPGDTLVYTATLDNIGADGAFVVGTGHVGDQLLAELEIYFAFLNDRSRAKQLFRPDDFVRLLRAYRLFEVGRTQDGEPLEIPSWLLDAEHASNMRDGA
jgi:3-hydroxyacyl-[acyl-carrier-protein] dehydratase